MFAQEGTSHNFRSVINTLYRGDASSVLEALYELQACFHHLSVKHEIPHHEAMATIVIDEKSGNERTALCLDLLSLLRSICDNHVPRPNPLLPLSLQPQWSDSDSDPMEEDDSGS